jgi:hypothetical protein
MEAQVVSLRSHRRTTTSRIAAAFVSSRSRERMMPRRHLAAVRALGLELDPGRFPCVLSWLTAMRQHAVFAHDRKRTAAFLKDLQGADYERRRLFWSGDRMEWLFARGFHAWFAREIEADRVAFPG